MGRLLLLTGLALAGCSSKPTPEEQIESRIELGRKAAEERDPAAIGEIVSDRYRDELGRDKRALEGLIAYHVVRQRSVHVLIKIRRIALAEPGRAESSMLVALAGTSIGEQDLLDGVEAELYRIDLVWTEEAPADWKVTSGRWRQIELGDFF